jgi:uncharacterized protein YgiM (DUF1202 family)
MRIRRKVRFFGLMALMLAVLAGCQSSSYYAYTPAPPPPPEYYYVLPSSTYVRGCPSYGDECAIIAQVFAGDRVQLLDRNAAGWSQVKAERTGMVGWIPTSLLSLSPVPAFFYVSANSEYLRECSDYNCRGLELLRRGDRVEKLDQDPRGWWRVMSLKSRKVGWIPVFAVSPQSGPPFMYVNVSSLALRSGPGTSYKMIGTLSLNDQVEVMNMGAGGWAQVRDVRRNFFGWCASRYLEAVPVGGQWRR